MLTLEVNKRSKADNVAHMRNNGMVPGVVYGAHIANTPVSFDKKAFDKIFKEAGDAYKRLEAASSAEWEPLKQIANNSFNELKNSFDEFKDATAQQIEEYSQETLDMSEKYIKDNPLKSVLLAAGVGFIIGLDFRVR